MPPRRLVVGALALREEGCKAGAISASCRDGFRGTTSATGTYRGDLQTKPDSSQQCVAGG